MIIIHHPCWQPFPHPRWAWFMIKNIFKIIIAMNKAIIIFMNKASMDKVLILFRWLRRFYSWLALWPVEEPPPGNTNIMNIMITNTMNP